MEKRCAVCFFKFVTRKGGGNAKVCPNCRQARKDKWRKYKSSKQLNYKIAEAKAKPPRSNVEARANENAELMKKFVNTTPNSGKSD